MANISKITVGDTEYNVSDAEARVTASTLTTSVANKMYKFEKYPDSTGIADSFSVVVGSLDPSDESMTMLPAGTIYIYVDFDD